MSASSLLLIGVGGAGSAIARGVSRAFGPGLRHLTVDTDALTGQGDDAAFVLLGGDRLSGRGAGGNLVMAHLAAEDSVSALDERLEGVTMAVVVTSLGGGTGSSATPVVLKRLSEFNITSIVFATTPFSFEGDDSQRNARSSQPLIEESANASFFLPLDELVEGEDNMELARQRGIGIVASGVTLFWRLLETPGYIRFDQERLRQLVAGAGRGRFATATATGVDRARTVIDLIRRSPLLASAQGQIRAAVTGVMAGDDLRLSEIATIADAVRTGFPSVITHDLATVNDEATFAGRLSVVVMFFEGTADDATVSKGGRNRGRGRGTPSPEAAPAGFAKDYGRFRKAEPTMYNGEDLDIPTYLRRGITLES